MKELGQSSFKGENPLRLQVTKRFKVKGERRLVAHYKLQRAVGRAFKAGKLEPTIENLGGEAQSK